jgi:acyl-CoA oxidase
LKQLAKAYAFVWTGVTLGNKFKRVMKDISDAGGSDELPEMHAMSAGLKAMTTFEVAVGMGDLRFCLGGHGVLLAAGLGPMWLDYMTYVTAEGDRIVLELQSARYLIKALGDARKGTRTIAYLKPLGDPAFDAEAALASCEKPASAQGWRDLACIARLLEARALNAVCEVGARLEASRKPFDAAWNECAIDLVRASRAHCYLMIVRNFVEALEGLNDVPVRRVMTRVCQLYALQNMEDDIGAFALTRAQQSALRQAIRELLAEVLSLPLFLP